MKKIATSEAIGHVLCHDITRIIKDKVKDTPFRKGHIVEKEDIPKLLSLGKEHLYIWEKSDGMLHENEAADILYGICKNQNLSGTEVREGKIEVIAEIDGLFRVNEEILNKINELEDVMIATRHGNTHVKKGDKLAGTRIIPLVIEKEKMDEVIKAAGSIPILELIPYKLKTVAIITTGSEIYHKRIEDAFTQVIVEKLKTFGIELIYHKIVDDNMTGIVQAIQEAKNTGAHMIICTGGMSVDPDDLTPGAIKESGANIVTYGAPVLPGAMFLMGYFEDGTPIMGLPGCVMYAKATIFDLLLPRVVADVKLSKKDIAVMGHGGLCLGCTDCAYPKCSFGK